MSVLKNFKDFAIKGNMVDLAIGVIIGTAFGQVITSIVQDITMPLLNPLMPHGRWREWVIAPGVKVGNFLGVLLNFLIVAIVMFGVVSLLHVRRRKKEEEKSTGKELDHSEVLLTDILAELKGIRKDALAVEGKGEGSSKRPLS
jgi:large conductance mechanosensitive channel